MISPPREVRWRTCSECCGDSLVVDADEYDKMKAERDAMKHDIDKIVPSYRAVADHLKAENERLRDLLREAESFIDTVDYGDYTPVNKMRKKIRAALEEK